MKSIAGTVGSKGGQALKFLDTNSHINYAWQALNKCRMLPCSSYTSMSSLTNGFQFTMQAGKYSMLMVEL